MATPTPNTVVKPTVPVNPWTTDQSTWEYVTIPEENALGEKHASLSINNRSFEPGNTYLVPPTIAGTLKERLHSYAKSVVRVMRPNVDVSAQQAVAVGSARQSGATPVDATQITTLP